MKDDALIVLLSRPFLSSALHPDQQHSTAEGSAGEDV